MNKIYKYCDKWLDSKKGYIRESTYINYSYAIKRFKKYFPNTEIDKLTKADVSKCFIQMADDKLAASTIYNVRQVMSAVYQVAIEEQYTYTNPFKKAKIPTYAPTKKIEAYTLEQQQAVIQACEEDILGDCYIFLLHTGLRKAEFINLKWIDYNAKDGTLEIKQSKTSSGLRKMALSEVAEEIIQKQKIYPHGHIFSTTKANPISITSLKKLCKRLSKKVGFKVTCHKARHTFCTRLVMDAKIDPKTVCSLSGHSSVAFLMQRYVTSDYEKQKNALNILNEILSKNNY